MVERYAVLVHPPQPSILSVPPTTTRYEPLRPSTVDDRDIAEAPFFAGRLPYCRPKPPSPPRPDNYTSLVCVEQNYRSATTIWRMGKSERRPFIRYRNNVATVIQRAAVCIDRQLDVYPRSLPIAAVRPVQHHAAPLHYNRRPAPADAAACFRRFYPSRRLIVAVAIQHSTTFDNADVSFR